MPEAKPYTKKDGKTYYEIRGYLGVDKSTGKKIKSTRRGFKSKKEAELAMAKLMLEVQEKGFKKKTYDTYQDFYDLWIEQYKNTVRESTYVKTSQLFRDHILPYLGRYRISELSILDCQKFVNKWFQIIVDYRKVKSYASKIFTYAMTLGAIDKNPMELVTMPVRLELPSDDGKIKFYTKDQVLRFLNCLEAENNLKIHAFFRLLVYTGIRRGEALALTWQDIDMQNNIIKINKNLSRGIDNRLMINAPKTKSSLRNISVDKETIHLLQQWRKEQLSQLKELGYKPKSKQLVFSSTDNDYIQLGQPLKWLVKIQKKYDLEPLSVHGFRHTHCSLLFEAGASIKEVQDRLGHSDVKTTMDIYAHLTEQTKEKTALLFEQHLIS